MKHNKDKIVLIDWLDSTSTFGWQEEAQCKVHGLDCQSIGFFIDETKDAIVIALNRSLTKDCAPYGQLITIPKVAIKKIKRVNL